MDERVCEYEHCSAPLTRGQKRFCTKSCRGRVVINARRWIETPIKCIVCLTEFVRVQGSNRKYCSDECRIEVAVKAGRKIDLQVALTENSSVRPDKIKRILIEQQILIQECSICGITKWMGKIAPLQLDHVNGINNDHRLENLRLLCANCHAQTDTFCGRNIGRKKQAPVE